LGEGTQDTRRRASFSELITRSTNEDVIDTVLSVLTDARLVMVDLAEGGSEKTIEVTHEALIREWPTLREWLNESRDDLRQHRQITADTLNWIRYGRDDGLLYRGVRLGNALKWMGGNVQQMSRLERQFIETSHQAVLAEKRVKEETQQRELQMAQDLVESQGQAAKRLRGMVTALGGAAVLMIAVIAILVTPAIQNAWAKTQARGEMIPITGGAFYMGATDAEIVGFELDWPAWVTEIRPFAIEKYEVSNEQYGLCVKFGDCDPPQDQTSFRDETKQDEPVMFVSLFQANSYCQWLGRRLSTELEWVRAARGPDDPRYWPWGNEPPTLELAAMPPAGTELTTTVTVTSVVSFPTGQSPEGVHNLVGNAREWTVSLVQQGYHNEMVGDYDVRAVWDGRPETFDGQAEFIQMGGGWEFGVLHLTYWSASPGAHADSQSGFRCAANVP
jgi:formylglycine-generating enzyme required for sulfatase activity